MTFDLFWQAQLRKESKIDAEKAWNKALRRATAEEIMAGWLRSKDHYSTRERQFIPLPATWLNKGRWMDEYESDLGRQAYVPKCRLCRGEISGAETAGFHPGCYDLHASKDYLH